MSLPNCNLRKFTNVTSEKSFRPPSDNAESLEFTFLQVGEGRFLATRRPRSWSLERPRESKEFKGDKRNAYLQAAQWATRSEVKKTKPKCPAEWADPEWIPGEIVD